MFYDPLQLKAAYTVTHQQYHIAILRISCGSSNLFLWKRKKKCYNFTSHLFFTNLVYVLSSYSTVDLSLICSSLPVMKRKMAKDKHFSKEKRKKSQQSYMHE